MSLTNTLVSAVCAVRKRCKSESKGRREALPENSRWLERLDEGTSFGFLVMCLFVHLLYGVDGFHWSHKCCLTVGAALAISTILVGSGRYEIVAGMYIRANHILVTQQNAVTDRINSQKYDYFPTSVGIHAHGPSMPCQDGRIRLHILGGFQTTSIRYLIKPIAS